jgi:hypothetical protein
LEVIAHDSRKKGSVRFGGIGACGEVRNRQAGLVGIHADGGSKPILGGGGPSVERKNDQEQE